mgnify:CR=1 FL=1
MVKKINSSEFEQVKNNKAIIVDFSAEWCGPCKMLAPVMEQLSDEITDVEFYNIDVDENPDLAREYSGSYCNQGRSGCRSADWSCV